MFKVIALFSYISERGSTHKGYWVDTITSKNKKDAKVILLEKIIKEYQIVTKVKFYVKEIDEEIENE